MKEKLENSPMEVEQKPSLENKTSPRTNQAVSKSKSSIQQSKTETEVIVFSESDDKALDVINLLKHGKELEAYKELINYAPPNDLGSLPPPEILRKYAEINPEIVERYLDEFHHGKNYMRGRIQKQDDAQIEETKAIRKYQLILAVIGMGGGLSLVASGSGSYGILFMIFSLGLVYAINPREERKFAMDKIIESLKKK